MKKIGIVIDGIRADEGMLGGGFNYYSQLCEQLVQYGLDVHLFSYPSAFEVFSVQDRFFELNKNQPGIPWKILTTSRDLFGQVQNLKKMTIIHSSSWSAIPALRLISRRYGLPFLFDCRTALFNINKGYNVYKWLVLRFFPPDYVIFVDDRSQAQYKNTYHRQSSRLLLPPIDLALFKPTLPKIPSSKGRERGKGDTPLDSRSYGRLFSYSESSQRDSSPPLEKTIMTLLFVGTLRVEKGVLDLMTAMERVWQFHPEIKLLIAGNGPLRAKVEAWSQAYSQVRYLGAIPNRQMPAVYHQADLLVLPSYFEGFPRTVLEGMACGLAVITTDVGGQYILREKDLAIVIQPGEPAGLEQAILTLVNNPEVRHRYAQAGRQYVLENHSWDKILNQLLNLYESLTA